MSLNSPDHSSPTPNNQPTEGKGNIFAKGLRRLLGGKNTSPAVLEQAISVWQEGEVPMTEVARIIKEQGPEIAKNLLAHYEHSFTLPFDIEGRLEDKPNNVQLSRNRGQRVIKVFIVSPDNKDTGYALEFQPNVAFRYSKDSDGSWEYDSDSTSIHAESGYVVVGDEEATEERDRRRGGCFYKKRVKMADLVRALGKYLQPEQSDQALPPATPKLNTDV